MPVVKDNRSYGDRKAIDDLVRSASGLKQGNADYVPEARNPVGRPEAEGLKIEAPQGGGQAQQQAAPVETSPYADLYHALGRALRTAEIADAAARDPMAGPWLRWYRTKALDDAEAKALEVRNATPYLA